MTHSAFLGAVKHHQGSTGKPSTHAERMGNGDLAPRFCDSCDISRDKVDLQPFWVALLVDD